jgi:glucokinase
MVTLGTGVGGGIISQWQDRRWCNFGAAGEIGHMTMINLDEDPACGCGKKGHLEQYASATGIARKSQGSPGRQRAKPSKPA